MLRKPSRSSISAVAKMFSGARLRRLRNERGLTQVALARALDLSTSYVNQLENDQRPITVPVLLALTERFDLPSNYFSADSDARLVADLSDVFTATAADDAVSRSADRGTGGPDARGRPQAWLPCTGGCGTPPRNWRRIARTRPPKRRCRRSTRCRSRKSATSSTTATTTSANSTPPPSRCSPRTR